MPDQADRLSFYTALFSILKIDEVDELKDEMKDRFGKFPPVVEHLIDAAVLRFFASYALFERIVVQKNKITFILPKGDREDFYQNKFALLLDFINGKYSRDVKFIQNESVLKLEMNNKFDTPEKVMSYLIKFCKEVSEVLSNN